MTIQNQLITNTNGVTYITFYIQPDTKIFPYDRDTHIVHYGIEGILTFMPLFTTLVEYERLTGYEFIFEDDLYADVLGIDDTYLIDGMAPMDSIQVCAGDWVKICEGWWTFEKNAEWYK